MLDPVRQRDTPLPALIGGRAATIGGTVLLIVAMAALMGLLLLGASAPVSGGEAGERLLRALAPGSRFSSVGADLHAGMVRAAYSAGDAASFAARLPAIAATMFAALALALLAWRGWGPWAAWAAVTLFAATPRVAAFGAIPDAEMLALSAALLAAAGYLRYRASQSRGAAASTVTWVSVAGLFGPAGLAVGCWLAIRAGAVGWRRTRLATGAAAALPRSPLAAVMTRRSGLGLFSFGATLALSVVACFAVWAIRSSDGPPRALPVVWPMLPAAAAIVAVPWTGVFVARALRRGIAARETAILALVAATVALIPGALRPDQAASAWLTPAAALLPLLVIDLAAALVAVAIEKRFRPFLALGAAATIVAVVLGGLLPGAVRHTRASRLSGDLAGPASDGTATAEARFLLGRAASVAQPWDEIVVRDGVSLDPAVQLGLPVAPRRVASLTVVAPGGVSSPRVLLLFRQPLGREEVPVLRRLLAVHPAVRLCPAEGCANRALWLLDLRASNPGIESYSSTKTLVAPTGGVLRRHLLHPGRETVRLSRQPWDEAVLDAAFAIVPTAPRRPPISLADATDRPKLLLVHNFALLAGDRRAASAARARLLEGFSAPTLWQDPAPFGRVVGAQWTASERRLEVVWECAGRPAAAADFALRFVFHAAGRAGKGAVADIGPSGACGDAQAGELREERFTLSPPSRAGWMLALEVTRPRGRHRRTTGSSLPLVDVPPR